MPSSPGSGAPLIVPLTEYPADTAARATAVPV
jgi:hypothetical protein